MDTCFPTQTQATGKQITPRSPNTPRTGISPTMQGTSTLPPPCALAFLRVLSKSVQFTNQQKTNPGKRKAVFDCHFSEPSQPVPGYGEKTETAFLQQQQQSI